jgi:hypothetical protein
LIWINVQKPEWGHSVMIHKIRQSLGVAMLRKLSEFGERGAFNPDEIRILVAAFDAAWEAVKTSQVPFSDPEYEENARDILARSIVYTAKIGERDERTLTEGALLQLARAGLIGRLNAL